jgi:hypothetical protein
MLAEPPAVLLSYADHQASALHLGIHRELTKGVGNAYRESVGIDGKRPAIEELVNVSS